MAALKAECAELKFVIEDHKARAQDMRRDRQEVEARLASTEKQTRTFIVEAEALRKQLAVEKKARAQAEKDCAALRDSGACQK